MGQMMFHVDDFGFDRVRSLPRGLGDLLTDAQLALRAPDMLKRRFAARKGMTQYIGDLGRAVLRRIARDRDEVQILRRYAAHRKNRLDRLLREGRVMLDAFAEALLSRSCDHFAIDDERGGGIGVVEVEAENCGHRYGLSVCEAAAGDGFRSATEGWQLARKLTNNGTYHYRD